MAYNVEETGELTRTAEVTVPQSEYKKKVNDALRKLSGQVKIRGFRKGKIPLSVMHQRYGQTVTRDVVGELVSENVNEVLTEMDGVLWVGVPQVSSIPIGDEGELEFSVDVELRPKIDPIGYLGLEVEKPVATLEGDSVDEALERMREQHASNEPVVLRDTIASGDIVTVDFQAIGDHPEMEQMKGEDVQIEVGAGEALPGIDEALEGAGFDATVESEVELGENFPVEELRGQNVPVRMVVKKVERRVLPEIDDDFAQKTGEGETLLELRTNLRKKLEEEREKQARELAVENMMERLLEQNPFELPPQFLAEQVKKSAEQRLKMFKQQGLDAEQFGLTVEALQEEMSDSVASQIRAELLLMEIARKEKIEVQDEDILAYFESSASQMGVNVQQYMGFMRQNPEMMRQAQATALLEKIRNHLLEEATIKDVEWPQDEEEEQEQEEAEEDQESTPSQD